MIYNLFELNGALPDATNVDPAAITVGTEFIVTADCWVTELRWYRGNADESESIRQGGLYRKINGNTPGELLLGPIDMPLPLWNAWGTYVLPTPYKLFAGETYRVAMFHPNGRYPAVSKWFLDGPNASPIVRGPITIPNTTGIEQGSYNYVWGLNWPDQTFNGAAYFSDVTITDVNPNPPDTTEIRTWDGTVWRSDVPTATREWNGLTWDDVDLNYYDQGWKPLL